MGHGHCMVHPGGFFINAINFHAAQWGAQCLLLQSRLFMAHLAGPAMQDVAVDALHIYIARAQDAASHEELWV